jgi:TonB-dependent receptor
MKFNPKALPITSKVLFTIVGGAVLINPAFAQDQAGDELEEVVVTGLRGSLKASMEIKRDATGVVDAISAEDIGKFPDTNLAESLQRITGVSIDRVNGEGGNVTVRGFGPNFNLVTLNGRQLPAASVGTISGNPTSVGSQGTSRSFDFSTLASEGVSGLEVYKTGNAAVPSGGIGATINIKTIRPLESGNKASIGAKAVFDAGSDNKATPEVSGLMSWANDAQTFGVSAFASYQERKSSARGVSVEQYQFLNYSPTLPNFLPGSEVVNAPADGQLIALPSNIGISDAQIDRKRINGMVTFQWAPSENTTLTADAMYTSNKVAQNSVVPGIWFSRQYSYVEFDGSDIVATPVKLIEPIALPGGRGKDLFYANYQDATKDDALTIGFNLNHKFGDAWSVDFDAATSSSESGGDGPNGYNSIRQNVAAAGAGWQGAFWGGNGKAPTATVGVLDNVANAHGNGNGVLDIPDISTQTFRTIDSTQKTDTDQFGLSATWNKNDEISVKFGVGAMSTKMHAKIQQTQDFLGGWGVGFDPAAGSDIPDPSLVSQVNVLNSFNDLKFGGYPDSSQFPTSGYYLTRLGQESFRVSPWAFAQAMVGNPLYPTWDPNNLTPNSYNNNTIKEDIYSAYGQAKFDGEIGGLKAQTVVGLRYEQTKVKSNALQNVVDHFTWTSDNDFNAVFGTELTALSDDAEYHNWLPNIDFSVALNDTMKVRASVSQTIARPVYNQMLTTTSVGGPSTLTLLGGIPRASKGNASLSPLESTNLDLSFEWYYGESSYASVGFFRKAVTNFVGTGVTTTTLFGLQDPSSGAPGTLSGDAAAALTAQGWAVNEQNMFTMAAILNNPADFPGGANDYIDPSETGGTQQALNIIAAYDIVPGVNDPLFQYQLSQPVNNQTANIDGEEIAWQHFFGDTGFGFLVNATFVNGDVGYNLRALPTVEQFALEGLSDSANAVLMYEKYGLSARLAYNWRDAFLTATAYQGQQGLPGFVDSHEQIDLNVTYNINDRVAIGLDGINITGEGQIIYSRTKQMQWWNAEGDPRWILTARYSFQ